MFPWLHSNKHRIFTFEVFLSQRNCHLVFPTIIKIYSPLRICVYGTIPNPCPTNMFVFLSHSGFLLSINWYAKTNNNLCNICPVVFACVIGISICEARAAKTKPRLLFGINRNARKIQGIRTQIKPKYTSANMDLQSVSKYNQGMHTIVPEYVFPLSVSELGAGTLSEYPFEKRQTPL